MARRPGISPYTKIEFDRINVLLVDDNPQALEILNQVVSGFGVRNVVKCHGAVEAQQALARHTIDLVITDAQMPEVNGYLFVRWLRTEAPESVRHLPVLMVTGHTRESLVLVARDSGANYTIAKPVTPKVVLDRIYWVAKDERMFIETETYSGPDRRFRREGPPIGMAGRRADDQLEELGEANGPNLSQDEIDDLMKPSKVSL